MIPHCVAFSGNFQSKGCQSSLPLIFYFLFFYPTTIINASGYRVKSILRKGREKKHQTANIRTFTDCSETNCQLPGLSVNKRPPSETEKHWDVLILPFLSETLDIPEHLDSFTDGTFGLSVHLYISPPVHSFSSCSLLKVLKFPGIFSFICHLLITISSKDISFSNVWFSSEN